MKIWLAPSCPSGNSSNNTSSFSITNHSHDTHHHIQQSWSSFIFMLIVDFSFTMFAPWEQKCSCLTYLTPRVVKECGISIIDVFQVVHVFEECNLVKVCNPNRVFWSPGLNDFIGYAYTCFHPLFKEQSNITSVSPSAIISRVCFWVLNFSLMSFLPSPCNSLCHYFSHQMCVHFVS